MPSLPRYNPALLNFPLLITNSRGSFSCSPTIPAPVRPPSYTCMLPRARITPSLFHFQSLHVLMCDMCLIPPSTYATPHAKDRFTPLLCPRRLQTPPLNDTLLTLISAPCRAPLWNSSPALASVRVRRRYQMWFFGFLSRLDSSSYSLARQF